MNNPRLIITDGTLENTINLLSFKGWSLQEWKPAVPDIKGGGVFRDSPLVDGRRLAYRKMENVYESFNLVGNSDSQDAMIASIQKLQRVMELATSYWTNNWQNVPVWIEAQATNESNIRYGVIVDYRLNGFGGPFEQPFFSGCGSATEAILTIEHMIWQETKPGDAGECAMAGNEYYSPEILNYVIDTFYPVAATDDCTVNTTQIDTTDTSIGVGYNSVLGDLCQGGIVFKNVTVPTTSYIAKATLIIYPVSGSDDQFNLLVQMQDPAGGSVDTFSTATDFWARDRLSKSVTIHLLDSVEYSSVNIDVTELIKQIICDPSVPGQSSSCVFASGDNICFFLSASMEGSAPILGREFYAIDYDGGSAKAELVIEYSSTASLLGAEDTCDHEIYVSNKHSQTIITHAYIYDAAPIGAFSGNLIDEALPFSLLPGTPAANDILYFGSDPTYDQGGYFNNVILQLSSAQTGINNGYWQYSTGAGWTTFDTTTYYTELCGDALLFNQDGVVSIVFTPQDDWDTQTINGVTAYWIRFVVSDADGGATAPVQAERKIYTAINPYIDIDADQVPGDIPALSRILIDAAGCYYQANYNTVVMGLRSLSRGSNFTAYLNASDIHNIPDMAFDYDHDLTYGLIDLPAAPAGRCLRLHGLVTSDEWTEACTWVISGDTAKEYSGVYHAYLRCDNSNYEMRYRLRAEFGEGFNVSYSDENTPPLVNWGSYAQAIDLGQIIIQPSYTMRPNDKIAKVLIALEAICADDSHFNLSYIYDVVLVPADEWVGNFGTPVTDNYANLYYGKGIDVDGITNPRQYRVGETNIDVASSTYDDDNRTVIAEWTKIASSEPILQANRNQRLWFMFYKQGSHSTSTFFENCGRVCVQRSARYLLARGSE